MFRSIVLCLLLSLLGSAAISSESQVNASAEFFKSGKAKMLKGDYVGAVKDYNEAARLNPNDALIYVNRGCAYNCIKDDKRALADYETAISVNPKLAVAYYNRASQMRRLKEFDKAIDDYNKAISLDSLYANAFYGRAWAYKLMNKKSEAIRDYLHASKLYASQGRDKAAYESKVRAEELK